MTDIDLILQRAYGIRASCVTPREGGFSALAYRVDAPEGSYFLKVYDKSKKATAQWTALIDNYMPVLVRMNRDPDLKGRIVEPICTVDGKYKYEDESVICLLFSYIAGVTVGNARLTDAQAGEMAKTVALVHRYTAADIPGSYENMTEDFGLPFCDRLAEFIGGIDRLGDGDVRATVAESRSRLEEAIAGVRRMAAALSQTEPKMVFCHTDIHGFNLMQGEALVLVDWEGLKLAPPEHDLMFFCNEPYFAGFMRVYRAYHPGFAVNRDMLDFYLLRRKLEDIWAFAERLTCDRLSDADRGMNLRFLRDLCASVG